MEFFNNHIKPGVTEEKYFIYFNYNFKISRLGTIFGIFIFKKLTRFFIDRCNFWGHTNIILNSLFRTWAVTLHGIRGPYCLGA